MALNLLLFVLFLHIFLLELYKGALVSSCIAIERNSLLDLKKNLEDKRNRLASWKHEGCCNWEGVSCNNVSGHVIRLNLRNPHHFDEMDKVQYNEWSLRGQLSPSLLGLKHLNYLDLSMNHFDGPIPNFIGSLHNLRYLNLSLAGFNGLIPHHLGNLSRLNYLDINHGWNGGGGVDSFALIDHNARWISCLTSLKHLTMKFTWFENFQNWVEALNVLPNIVEIHLNFCNFFHFPLSLSYVNFTNLSYLDLSDNGIFLETIPLWLFNIKSLTHIDLSNNDFNSIPDALQNLTSLEYIDFSQMGFTGDLPRSLRSLCKLHTLYFNFNRLGRGIHELTDTSSGCLKDSIEILDLSDNLLSGSLPDSFGELHRLKIVNLENNLLSGHIPESLGRLVALQELILSKNNMSGTIPKSIGQLSNLVRIYLDGNSFEGVISEVHFGSLTKLKELNLVPSKLILNVSHDWIPPFELNIINMGSCKIGPKFPHWLQTQVNLSFLNLSSSDIVDFLPNWFWDIFTIDDICVKLDLSSNGIAGNLPPFSKLCFHHFDLSSNFFAGTLPSYLNVSEFFDVSNNSFSGSIPHFFGNQPISSLYLSRNKFTGDIPSSICLANVMLMDLSRNLLTGEIPNCWNQLMYQLPGPVLFDFSRNNLSGNIPHTLGTLIQLESLHLGYNDLSGNIPTTLGNLIYLLTLDLGMNNLKGAIPTWFGENLTYLKVLVLRSNNFTGNVPSNLSKLKQLQILELGNNKLSGRIPPSFGNFTGMIDVQSRSQASSFLGFYVELPYLSEYLQLIIKGRYESYDRLLTLVTIIDLSCNNLSDHIPKELGNLHSLNFLNLSGNNLLGSIPDEIGLMHSLESLDLSRNGISGNIPLSMSTMTTLDFLNLSFNDLSGRIPSGNQLQTFTNESYIGNPKLCGFPLTQSCDKNKKTNDEVSVDEVTESDYWYLSIALGFVIGFWIVWGTFFVKKRWKDTYFGYVDYVYDAINVFIAVNINRFKRKIGNETASG